MIDEKRVEEVISSLRDENEFIAIELIRDLVKENSLIREKALEEAVKILEN